MHWHAFGPLAAVALVLWSLAAIRQRRLIPRPLAGPLPYGLAGGTLLALLGYWLLRLQLGFGPALAGAGSGG